MISRDASAPILFHNFLGTLGVTQALAASGKLEIFGMLQWPLLATAAASLATRSPSTPSSFGGSYRP